MRISQRIATFGYTKEELAAIPAEDFAGPEQRFPINERAHVADAWDLAGFADKPDELRAEIKKIAIRKGWESEIPEAAKDVSKMALDDMSDSDIASAVGAAVSARYPGGSSWESTPWVRDLYFARREVVYQVSGKTWRQTYAIADDGKVTLEGAPVEVQQVTSYEPVAMSAFSAQGFSKDGDDLVYEGEIFRAGEYPDKDVSATPATLVALAGRATGLIKAKVQHVSTAFDKALEGYGLEKVEHRDNGTWLWGRARFPGWLQDALGNEFKVSVGLSKTGKVPQAIEELSIVNEGRVPTAKLVAAFTAFAGSRHSAKDLVDIQSIHDLAVSQGATCATAEMTLEPAGRPGVPAKEKRMNLLEKVLAFFGKDPKALEQAGISPDEIKELETAQLSSTAVAPATPDPELMKKLAAFEADHKGLTARLDAQNERTLAVEAAEFARDCIEVQRKAYPAEKEELQNLYIAMAKADGGGVANFGNDGTLVEGQNVKTLKASIEKRRALSVFEQSIPDGQQRPADDLGGSEEHLKASIMSGSPLGRAVQRNQAARTGFSAEEVGTAVAAAMTKLNAGGTN